MTVKLSKLDAPVLGSLAGELQRVCSVADPHDAAGVCLDPSSLSADEQVRFDDGMLPEHFMNWWLTQAERVREQEGAALITLQPGLLGQRRVEPLRIDAFHELFDHTLWTIPLGVVLAWGVPERTMNGRHLRRIPCAGALGVVVDGYGAVLVADSETCAGWPW